MKTIKEIQIKPVKPNKGLVAFASFVLFDGLYCSSVAIVTRPEGGYRLLYPTKKVGDYEINIFHPINREIGDLIEQKVIYKLKEVMNNVRHNSNYTE